MKQNQTDAALPVHKKGDLGSETPTAQCDTTCKGFEATRWSVINNGAIEGDQVLGTLVSPSGKSFGLLPLQACKDIAEEINQCIPVGIASPSLVWLDFVEFFTSAEGFTPTITDKFHKQLFEYFYAGAKRVPLISTPSQAPTDSSVSQPKSGSASTVTEEKQKQSRQCECCGPMVAFGGKKASELLGESESD